jgi:hypothetical protein
MVQFHSILNTETESEQTKRNRKNNKRKRFREKDHTCISSVQKGDESDQSPFHSIAPQGFLTKKGKKTMKKSKKNKGSKYSFTLILRFYHLWKFV